MFNACYTPNPCVKHVLQNQEKNNFLENMFYVKIRCVNFTLVPHTRKTCLKHILSEKVSRVVGICFKGCRPVVEGSR